MFYLYIDPGSGSLLFQALISSILTIVVFYKKIVALIKYRFFRNKKTKNMDQDPL